VTASQKLADAANEKFTTARRAGRQVQYIDCYTAAKREHPEWAAEVDRIATPQAIAMANERVARGKCEVFQKEASRQFIAFANERSGADWNAKWRSAKALARDLYALMDGRIVDHRRAVEILSAPFPTAITNESAMPGYGPQNVALLGLPIDTTPAEYTAAWIGNGRQMSPRNAKAILIALTELAHKERGGSAEAAAKYVLERFSALAREAGMKK
jgi:hypothetical protein